MTGGEELVGLGGELGLDAGRAMGREGKRRRAHGGSDGVLEARGRPGGSESTGEVRRPEVEDDGVAGDAGLGEASASAERTRATRRS